MVSLFHRYMYNVCIHATATKYICIQCTCTMNVPWNTFVEMQMNCRVYAFPQVSQCIHPSHRWCPVVPGWGPVSEQLLTGGFSVQSSNYDLWYVSIQLDYSEHFEVCVECPEKDIHYEVKCGRQEKYRLCCFRLGPTGSDDSVHIIQYSRKRTMLWYVNVKCCECKICLVSPRMHKLLINVGLNSSNC